MNRKIFLAKAKSKKKVKSKNDINISRKEERACFIKFIPFL